MSPYKIAFENKSKTWILMSIFIFIFTGFFYLIGEYFDSTTYYLFLGLSISSLSSLISYFYSDKIILWTMNAKPADKKKFYDLYTTTENLSIAAGIPMPKLYVINDPAPNAFATGRNPKNAVICVTTGLLNILDRSDIEGVIAHEISHIKNYDILLASIVSVLVGAISIVTDLIMRSFWWGLGGRREEKKNPFFLILFFLSLIIIPIAATLIQLAISRKREFLADASAVLLTRNPEGLADALEKINQYQLKKFVPSSFAHMFIINPLNSKNSYSWFANLFSTHPPIEERIRILRNM